MSHLDHDELPEWDEVDDAFEQKLHSIRPSPPKQSWSSIAESIEASFDQPAVVSNVTATSSAWRSVVSHSVTAAIGIAVGVVLMLGLPPNETVYTELSISPAAADLTNQQEANQSETDSFAKAIETTRETNQRSESEWQSQRFTMNGLHARPLRAFGSIGDSGRLLQPEANLNSRLRPNQQTELGDEDSSPVQIESLPLNRPILSPRSLHLFEEMTHVPILDVPFCSDVPFCKAKGC